MAVCHPHKYREFNHRLNTVCRILVYTGPALTLSILLNLPKFYETKVSQTSICYHFKKYVYAWLNTLIVYVILLVYNFD